ncbi:MAG: TetR/AcrR family transcriptional regulator C-terminal domain-containing protein [Micrococcales bacterium]|nr:TetR/AcrR family transcriptional regulator C-terminal domain-containing protein [Micrococcales bacterium]
MDRRSIVAAALEVLEDVGLDALSQRAIAARLGVRQPALYHHFASKDDLLAALAEEVLTRHHTARLPEPDEPWDHFVARNARSLRGALLGVRDGARLVASAGPRAPALDTAVAQVRLLEGAGFSGAEAVLALIAVSRYVIGSALEQETSRDGAEITVHGGGPGALPGGHDEAAAHLAAVAREVAALGQEHEFEVGLAALLRGLAPRR